MCKCMRDTGVCMCVESGVVFSSLAYPSLRLTAKKHMCRNAFGYVAPSTEALWLHAARLCYIHYCQCYAVPHDVFLLCYVMLL